MITLIGHGYVGTAIAKELEAQGIDWEWLRHNDKISGRRCIINATGMNEVTKENYTESLRANVLYPLELSLTNQNVIHIGTCCNNGSLYANQKRLMEDYIAGKNTILRLYMPFDETRHKDNNLHKIAQKKELWDINLTGMTYLPEFAKIVVEFALSNLLYLTPQDLVNPGIISMQEIASYMKLDAPFIEHTSLYQQVIPTFIGMSPLPEAIKKAAKEYNGL